jgi:hypothetical protein
LESSIEEEGKDNLLKAKRVAPKKPVKNDSDDEFDEMLGELSKEKHPELN